MSNRPFDRKALKEIMLKLSRTIGRLAVASSAVAALSLAVAPAAFANNAQNVSPASGTSQTSWTFDTTGAMCSTPTSSAGGDVVDSFVVDNAIVDTTQLGNLTFDTSGGPHFGSYSGVVIVDTGGTAYSNKGTLPVTGQINSTLGPFSWSPYVGDWSSSSSGGTDLYAGTEFNVGVACVKPSGVIDNNEFWSLQVSFPADSTSAQFDYQSQPGPTTPEVPLAAILPISAVVIIGGAGLGLRRRQRAKGLAS